MKSCWTNGRLRNNGNTKLETEMRNIRKTNTEEFRKFSGKYNILL